MDHGGWGEGWRLLARLARNNGARRFVERRAPTTRAARLLLQQLSVPLLALGDLLSVDCDVARRLDADSNLRAVHRHYGDLNILADVQCLAGAASEYKHLNSSLWTRRLFSHGVQRFDVGAFRRITVGLR